MIPTGKAVLRNLTAGFQDCGIPDSVCDCNRCLRQLNVSRVCVCCPDSGPWFISSCLSSHFLTHFSLPVCLRTSFHLCLSPLVSSSVCERAFWECEWGNTRLISSFVSPTHVKLFRERRWSSGVCVWDDDSGSCSSLYRERKGEDWLIQTCGISYANHMTKPTLLLIGPGSRASRPSLLGPPLFLFSSPHSSLTVIQHEQERNDWDKLQEHMLYKLVCSLFTDLLRVQVHSRIVQVRHLACVLPQSHPSERVKTLSGWKAKYKGVLFLIGSMDANNYNEDTCFCEEKVVQLFLWNKLAIIKEKLDDHKLHEANFFIYVFWIHL